jgi:uncharacterized protein (DUF983 family)
MKGYRDTILDFAMSQDDLEFSLGDALDVKSSIFLVVITFLAIQSAAFLSSVVALSAFWHWAQILSVALLVCGGLLALLELIPRNYKARMATDEFLDWVSNLERHYKDEPQSESIVLAKIQNVEMERVRLRFIKNRKINSLKSTLNGWCFRCTMGSLALNLLTLLALSWRG